MKTVNAMLILFKIIARQSGSNQGLGSAFHNVLESSAYFSINMYFKAKEHRLNVRIFRPSIKKGTKTQQVIYVCLFALFVIWDALLKTNAHPAKQFHFHLKAIVNFTCAIL